MVKEEEIQALASSYYSRKDIQEAIFQFSKKREIVPRYIESFGKRPDSLEYAGDLQAHVKKGATSFHVSEELWSNPLSLSTEMNKEQQDEIREGWDLLIDIDSKYLDYSRISAKLIADALEFHSIKSYACKFSGSKGFHIIVPWKAFPKELNGVETRKMFPEWPRLISQYLTEFIKKQLVEQIAELTTKSISKYIRGDAEVGDAVKHVMPDIVLVSPRHLFRAPYSLHEKTRLASIVIKKENLLTFSPQDANPLGVSPKSFYPDAREGEARELLMQALDWEKAKEKPKEQKIYTKEFNKDIKIKNLTPDLYPPCINNILNGMKDGKKRALFILINFFRSMKIERDEIEKKVEEWNKKNSPALREGYVKSQIDWTYKQKPMLPQNCDKPHYKDIGVCAPDELCKMIKNPINYPFRKIGRKRR